MKAKFVSIAVRAVRNLPLMAMLLTTSSVSPAIASNDVSDPGGVAVMGKGADISKMCGVKPMIVGLSDGYGGNTWRRTTLAEIQDELSACKNVEKFIYTNANGDQQKANADINSLVAQGVNVLIVFPDFGTAQIPAMRSATKAGVTVIAYFSKLGGVNGKDYSANLYQDTYRVGQAWADWYGKNLKTGNVLFLGGTPGATSSQNFLNGLKAGLKKHSGIKLLDENYIVTNWNPVDAQKAVTGLLAKYPKIDAIATDYGVTAMATVKTFEQAGLAIPAIATLASNNELNCKYLTLKKAGKAFPYFSLDGTTSTVRFAARRAVANFQGTRNPEPMGVIPFVFADSASGLEPKCSDSAPPDADLSSLLPDAKLNAIFKR
ncbi:MAG: substrate-binding domain-containing protein [Betaproteobacteria bacterium]|nr:substrate-binding domain-containing protein [Betaproteobacteria bacterium]